MADSPRFFPSVSAELELFDRIDQRTARRAAARSQATNEMAARVSGIRSKYPFLSPTVALGLAQQGLDADDPRMKDLVTADAKVQTRKKGGVFGFAGDVLGGAARLGDTLLGGVDEALAGVAKPVVRTAAVGALSLYEEAQGAVRNIAAVSPEAAGAGVGAALGSIVPGVGTAIGAGVGGALGGTLGFLARDEVKGEARWEPQSSGAISLGRVMAGEKVELGEGWLPNVNAGESETGPDSTFTVGEEQRQRSRRVTVGGRSLTPGRLLTAGVLEPGSQPYNIVSGLVDATVALSRFDPASAGLKVAGNVNRNRKLFVDAGGLFSHRPAISPQAFERWIDRDPERVIQKLADIADESADVRFLQTWEATDGKFGAKLTRDIADSFDPDEIKGLLRERAGRMRAKPTFSTFHPLSNVRLAQTMPGTHFDPYDADESVRQVQRWLQNVKASPEQQAKGMRVMADADTSVGRFDALKQVLDITKDVLVEKGVDPARARAMTRIDELADPQTRAYFVKNLVEGEDVWGPLVVNGVAQEGPSPHLVTEMLNRTLTLPDVRDIRRASSGFSAIFDKDLYKNGVSAIDFAQGNVWKKSALLRGAYTVRVIAEEQFRMAASGLDSLVSHPMSLIAFRLGKKGESDVKGGKFEYKDASDFDDALDEFNKALNREFEFNGWADSKVKMHPWWKKVQKSSDPDEFVDAAASEVMQLAGDPIAREIARRMDDLDTLKAEFFGDGGLRPGDASGGLDRLRRKMAENPRAAQLLGNRTGADRYIDSIVDRIQYKTAGQTDLIDTIATGKFAVSGAKMTGKVEVDAVVRAADRQNYGRVVSIDGDTAQVHFVNRAEGSSATVTLPVSDLTGVKASKAKSKVPAELTDFIRNNLDAYADDVVMKRQMTTAERGAGGFLDTATRWMFSNLMGERTNNLSRSPTFKQFYWQRQEELIPFADAVTQQKIIDGARAAKMDDVASRMAERQTKFGAGAKITSLDDADTVAKGFALDSTRDLLYDLSERSQFFDVYRMIFPFGEAWKEMVTRWAKIGQEHPEALRRGQQIIVGGRNADPDGNGKGFFYTNEQNEEVFAFPGSGWVSEKMIGVPVPLTGRLAGLSLMTEVLPGVGPVVQFSAGAFLPDKPEFDWMRDILFPFSEPDTKGGVVESLLPAWMRKFKEAGATPFAQDTGQFNSAVMDVARYLVSTGKYDTSNTEGINRLISDASQKARYVYALRGAAQFFAPTAPTPEWIVADPDGDALVAQQLIGEYQDLLKQDPNTATLKMLDRYGDGIFLLLQGKTAEVVPGSPITKEGADWERANTGIVKSFPQVFGFFAPQGDDLDSSAFARQMAKGRRVRITPDQAVHLANGRRAAAVYAAAKAKAGPRPSAEAKAWLRQIRQGLTQNFPGFGERVGVPEGASTDLLISQLTDAVEDERLADNPVAESVKVYLAARQKASDAAVAAGLTDTSFRSAAAMEGTRAWLRQIGEALVDRDPQFEAVWSRVFDRELADDVQQQAVA